MGMHGSRGARRMLMIAATLLACLSVAGPSMGGDSCEPREGPMLADNEDFCMPTPEECASGRYNGVYDGHADEGRVAICLAAEGHIIVYVGGNLSTPCGAAYVADRVVASSAGEEAEDPNKCARAEGSAR